MRRALEMHEHSRTKLGAARGRSNVVVFAKGATRSLSVAHVHFRLPRWLRDHAPELVAVAAFVGLSVIALSYAPRLVEPDDYAYRGSIVALDQGHVELTTAQYDALAKQLGGPDATGIGQWVQLSNGKWISEKNPGYPFLAVPFEALGILRLAPLFYGLLGCLGLFFGGRRWLGRWGGAFAVGLFCSSGAALFFAWRDGCRPLPKRR